MEKKKILYFFYNRLNDPLLQSNIFLYINALSTTGRFDIAIITYEDEKFPLSDAEKKDIHATFKLQNIQWHPLEWHAGSNLFLKSIDLLSGFRKLMYLSLIKGYRHIISLGSIAGSFLYLFSKTARIKFYLYQYEPHSEYALDNGLWAEESLQYRLLHSLEKKSVKACTVVSSGTNNMRHRLEDWKIKASFFKVCSVANDALFNFNNNYRRQIRKELNIADTQKLVIYPGKLGELYCSAEKLLLVFKALKKQDDNFCFLVITPNMGELTIALQDEELSFKNSVKILSPVSYTSMPYYLSAADLGVVGVLPGPSKKFISNIKVGEYLCSGLPYLICRGISEDDLIAETYNVGVVVENFKDAEITGAYKQIKTLVDEPKEQLVARCRHAGIVCRGFDNQYAEFKKAIDALVAE